jgi:NAD(P)-dependent dehydrogenase (short-subunit alcohol dehydrogenase family)
VTPVVLDLLDPQSPLSAVQRVLDEAGGLEAVVNNAGQIVVGSMEETSNEDIHRVFEVNCFGPLRLVQAALPAMRAAGGGRIVNITSLNDMLCAPFGGAYSASKAAFMTASYALRAETASMGIAVTVIAPGLFATDMSDQLGQISILPNSPYAVPLAALAHQEPARRATAGDPDLVAEAVTDCLGRADPPARIVVGRDAVSMEDLVRKHSVEDVNAMLRDVVTGLEKGPSGQAPAVDQRPG